MTYKHVRLDVRNTVGWFRFDRAPVNAVDWEMLGELQPAFEDLCARPEVRVVVIATAIDRYFSTGADIAAFAGAPAERMDQWVEATHRLASSIRAADKPVLAAIRGVAVGGGLEMSLHADLRFAASDARLGQPEINIAFIPPVAGTQALVRLVGRSQAFQMLYGGELMDARTALSIGLVDVVCEPDALEDDVQGYGERLASKPANALATIRRCLVDGGSTTFDGGLAIEREQAAGLTRHPNFQIGVKAFLEKIKPVWK
jgi:enoyl-CoA hydratase/carnithine racemase